MISERLKLSDVCVSISDGDHQAPPKADHGIPFITISDFTATNTIDFSNTMFVPKSYYDSVNDKRKARSGDILYSVVGSYGIPVFIKDDKQFVFQRHIAILRPNNRVIPRYLYYSMLNHDFYLMADAAANGAAQKTVSLTSLRNMEVSIPDISTQEKIVSILSTYDDLIENNQKQIKLLEEAAQRIYKEWFVDLRFPGCEKAKIVDGVPEGWKSGELGDIAFYSGISERKENREEYSYYLPIDCLPKKSIAYINKNEVSLAESSLVGFNKNDILFGAMRPYFHKVVVARDKGLTRSTCFVINSKMQQYWEYLLMLLFSKDTVDYATQISVGTTMPYVRLNDFLKMPVVVPDERICELFNDSIIPIINDINCKAISCENAKEVRDRLLPKLISGEIEV